jgi:hypothetical protein
MPLHPLPRSLSDVCGASCRHGHPAGLGAVVLYGPRFTASQPFNAGAFDPTLEGTNPGHPAASPSEVALLASDPCDAVDAVGAKVAAARLPPRGVGEDRGRHRA